MKPRPLKVLVCGSTFGQFWLSALQHHPQRFVIAGMLASGSARSVDCANRYDIPLYTNPASLPDDIDIACVVLRAAVMGGAGSELAQQLMVKGIHVIQEQPVHHDEVVANLRIARQYGVQYRVGNLYPHLPAVHQFIQASERLLRRQKPQFIDAACASQVAFPLIAMLAEALDTTRPWQFIAQPQQAGAPFQSVQGSIGGIPLTLNVHNEVDPEDPDNHFHLLHQITLGFPGGRLSLTDTHGPVMWRPRLHIPDTVKRDHDFSSAQSAHLMEETSAIIGEAQCPNWRTALSEQWPAAIGVDLLSLADSIQDSDAPRWSPQSLLSQCQMWQALTKELGYPSLKTGQNFAPLARSLLPATVGCGAFSPVTQFAFARRAESLLNGIEPREITDFVARMDEACLNAMLFSFQQGGSLTHPDQGSDVPGILQQMRVAPDHHALIARWLTLLVDAGWVIQRGQHYFSRMIISESALKRSWQEVHDVWDNRLGSVEFVDYLWRNAEKLPELMRGEQQAALLLFPEGRNDIADAVYRHTITARYLNTLIADWILEDLSARPTPLQVLEIGAGTGATTERVRELLQEKYGDTPPVTWEFSDVSRFFLVNAQQRYGHLPWLSTSLIDIDKSLLTQGVAAESQDLLVMAGVLNNAQNSEQTIRWLTQTLRAGGHMLITEPTREHLEILTSQAFMMPPPNDDRQRSDQRFLTPEQWQDLFKRAGLECVACLPGEAHLLAPLGQRLFIVRRPSDA
ncbi:bifunctional Gfo/Idh/MocA family oxidoreductase/class I SAM-dependent methyltransferase [Pantoea sp. GbtcB22]|uniref:bifunctional Gfo/Idh/MocA family oxidoreductase/class I SAM-dependent methyltransferase n=1 Tax=Pantoea sp. GbtcB22 TaxID=2824767 RepID=UPI001C3021A2|nr:bifunctional Gfo/Idh/MocA family oxidoreductase/class I SAM-dependent methyltransferase [Pantoea sp. GbtcB22]